MTAYTNSNVIVHDLPNEAGAQTVPDVPRALLAEAWWRLRRSRLSMLCLAVVAAYLAVGLLSFLPYFDVKVAQQLSTDKSYAPPAFRHTWPDGRTTISPAVWFGLDFQGRSVFWRVLFGTRIALLITLGASILSISIGAVLGVIAGYYGGWIDDLITWLFSTVSSVPWLLLVIAMAYVLQGNETPQSMLHHPVLVQLFGGVTTVILAMGLTDWVGLCRLIRGEVLKLRERDFVLAGRAMGLGNARILFRHILPNTYHVIIITFSLGAVSYVQAEVILAFLGLGVTDKPSWGRMIDDAKLALLRGVWWEVTAATVAIFILCLALNILGDALRDALDPKLRGLD